MEQIAVKVVKEDQTVPLVFEGFADKVDAFFLQLLIGFVEVIGLDGQMADASVFIVRRGLRFSQSVGGRNDFEHCAVGCFHEEIAGVAVVDVEFEMVDVPVSESFRVG